MTKQEFLDELRGLLNGAVSAETTMDAYRFYSNYIDEEVRKGKTEAEVITELGKPFLIAKSIIAASSGERDADMEYTEDGRMKKVSQNKNNGKTNHTREKKTFQFDINGWYVKVFGILLLLLLIVLVFFIVKIGVLFFLTFGIPILIFLGILYLIMYFFKD